MTNSFFAGALFALIASFVFSLNDMLIKFLSDGYALHQIVFVRSVTGVILLPLVVVPLTTGYAALRTARLGAHVLRSLCVVGANLFFYMGLASLDLAEVVGIFFIGPFVISIFSVLFLGETVGPQRWAAIALGFVGVLLIIRPGTEAFTPVSLLPALAATCYAVFHIMTRYLSGTETAISMTFYPPLVFMGVAAIIGLSFGHGAFAPDGTGSIAFLLRGWTWPAPWDLAIMVLIGFGVTAGGYTITMAYRSTDAALIAPFEYSSLIWAATFGWVLFGEWPDRWSQIGLLVVLASGLFLVWREVVNQRTRPLPPNSPR